MEHKWGAILIGYVPGPVVQIGLCVESNTVYCARIFPPYHVTDGEWISALPHDRLAAGVLRLFAEGKLKVTPPEMLEHYQRIVESGILKFRPDGAPTSVFP